MRRLFILLWAVMCGVGAWLTEAKAGVPFQEGSWKIVTVDQIEGLPPEAMAAMQGMRSTSHTEARTGRTQTSFEGLPPEAMAALKQAEAQNMSPEGRAMMQQLQGAAHDEADSGPVAVDSSWDGGRGTTTTTQCVTAEDQMQMLPQTKECSFSQNWVGSVFTFSGACQGDATISGELVYAGVTMTGDMIVQAQGMTIKRKISGQYLGPCVK